MKVIAFIILCLVSDLARSEWRFVAESDTFSAYMDMQTIRRDGTHLFVWEMLDYRSPKTTSDGKRYKSIKSLNVYKCQEYVTASKYEVAYQDQMGQGVIVASRNLGSSAYTLSYADIIPGSVLEETFKMACGL